MLKMGAEEGGLLATVKKINTQRLKDFARIRNRRW
jgi:hypothetical protein